MTPTVSVVIASKNYAHYLPEAIRSVLAQTWTDFELLIVDDGSVDNTAQVVRPFLADPRVCYIPNHSSGTSRARNLGVRLARGEWIAFLDADDSWFPTKLEKQLDRAMESPQADAIFTRRELMNPDGDSMPTPQLALPRGQILEDLLQHNRICFSSVMIRRELLNRYGGFDTSLELAIDYDLWLRLAPHVTFDYVDEILVRYRTGHANLSRRSADRVTLVLSILRRCLNRRSQPKSVPTTIEREAWASTYRSMAYVERSSPKSCAWWHWCAVMTDGRLAVACRGIAASVLRRLRNLALGLRRRGAPHPVS